MVHGRFVELSCVLAMQVQEWVEGAGEKEKDDYYEAQGRLMSMLVDAYMRLDRDADAGWKDVVRRYNPAFSDGTRVAVDYIITTFLTKVF